MNKRYMDFVPSNAPKAAQPRGASVVRGGRSSDAVSGGAARGVRGGAGGGARRGVAASGGAVRRSSAGTQRRAATAERRAEAVMQEEFSVKNGVSLGVVEDFSPKFVKTEVEKRPLSSGPANTASLQEAKARKIGGRRATRLVEKPVEKSSAKGARAADKSTLAVPKNPFINQGKVEKRPLSKNVYQKKIVAPKEEPSGPVTIISKPEKDKHVGLVVAIILTIILGAAAGTVAFLLLPK